VLPPRELLLEPPNEPLPIERVVVDDEPTLRLLEPTVVLREVVVVVPLERELDDEVPRTVVEVVLRLDEVEVPLFTFVVVVVVPLFVVLPEPPVLFVVVVVLVVVVLWRKLPLPLLPPVVVVVVVVVPRLTFVGVVVPLPLVVVVPRSTVVVVVPRYLLSVFTPVDTEPRPFVGRVTTVVPP
jgi:hypothetical protein